MDVLRFFESIRTPFLDGFFSLVTMLGEETLFIVIGLVFFWCISKKEGYYILSVGFIGTVLNQFLKIVFRIPRPWVIDENFTIVESARAEATGYSFPSGHTQMAVGTYGAMARWHKNLWVRVLTILACVLVPLSRMYLGVHTPIDVFVSIVLALILVFGFYPVFKKAIDSPRTMRILFLAMAFISVLYLGFVTFYPFPENVDGENLFHAISNGYKMLGCVLGLLVAFEIDTRFTHFETKAPLIMQILKFVLGLIPVILIKSLLKQPLLDLFGGNEIASAVRYFLLTLFAGGIWPMTFKWFNRKVKK